jgi:glycosyltransferase involved in cell wall biosynthesis
VRGVTLRRFPITNWQPDERARLDIALRTRKVLSSQDQYAWLQSGPVSHELNTHVATHAAEFDILVMLPYANPLVHHAAWLAPERTVLWPCLHDEPYAYLEPVRLLLETVWGVLFNTPEEQALATEKIGMALARHAVVGVGTDFVPAGAASGERADMLYVGRLEEGKNVPQLYQYVRRMVDDGLAVRLVVAGSGPVHPPHHPAFVFRRFLSEDDKARVYAQAAVLCQPSLNESFSIVAMEAWLSGTPVLVNEACAVTRGHVRRSRGGLWYRSYEEFAAAVRWLQDHAPEAARMGANGRQYVEANYRWPEVVRRFSTVLECWRRQSVGGRR